LRYYLPSGESVSSAYAPLNMSYCLKSKIYESLASIKYGLSRENFVSGKICNNTMRSQGWTDEEIVDIMNYILN